jgi:hypothetical protein
MAWPDVSIAKETERRDPTPSFFSLYNPVFVLNFYFPVYAERDCLVF